MKGIWWLALASACGIRKSADGANDPLASVDVVVIGAGTAGLAAGWQATDTGASVILVERDDHAGGSSTWAGRMWAAGTSIQQAAGVEDSPELALSEWADFTEGSAENPLVQRFVEESAETLEWLEGFGLVFYTSVDSDPETGSVPRIHGVDASQGVSNAGAPLVEAMAADTWLQTEGAGLVVEDGRVVGVRVHDLADDTTGWIEAGAVVVATGGMSRDEDRLLAAWPGLAEVGWVNEALPHMDGNGLGVIVDAGGALSNLDSIGTYAHSVDDPRFDEPGVALLAVGISDALIVDQQGQRVMNEGETRGFYAGRLMAETGPLYVVADAPTFASLQFKTLPFDWGVDSYKELEEQMLTPTDYLALSGLQGQPNPDALASSLGVDAAALNATLERYNLLVASGTDDDFSKDLDGVAVLDTPPFYALALRPGPSKSFGGATLGDDTQVLDGNGNAIPGLYAAGEVAGVLGGDQTGWGFSGAVSACWWGGRVAGTAAAAEALALAE